MSVTTCLTSNNKDSWLIEYHQKDDATTWLVYVIPKKKIINNI